MICIALQIINNKKLILLQQSSDLGNTAKVKRKVYKMLVRPALTHGLE